jgi:FKBP-type peptidyl-prolyl cis-trans isomerase FkpA
MRPLLRVLAPFTLAVVACGGPNPAAMKAAADAHTMTDAERGDAICGAGWKWNGQRCIHAEEPVASSTTTAKGGPLDPTPPPSRSPGFNIEEVVPGNGAEAKPVMQVRVHYTGMLADGTVFDSSKQRGQPFEFRLGQGMVIKGFERGILGMKVGGVRKVTIPSDLGYGRKGAPPNIPPNATLVFDLELLDAKP